MTMEASHPRRFKRSRTSLVPVENVLRHGHTIAVLDNQRNPTTRLELTAQALTGGADCVSSQAGRCPWEHPTGGSGCHFPFNDGAPPRERKAPADRVPFYNRDTRPAHRPSSSVPLKTCHSLSRNSVAALCIPCTCSYSRLYEASDVGSLPTVPRFMAGALGGSRAAPGHYLAGLAAGYSACAYAR
jgi:hypothetical protein